MIRTQPQNHELLKCTGPALAAGGTGMTSGKGTPDAARDTSDKFDETAGGPALSATDATRVRLFKALVMH